MAAHRRQSTHERPAARTDHYRRLGLMALLSFASMYALMYAMADRFANVYANLNQAYMAALMTAPMILIELVLMRSMYPNRTLNMAAIGVSLLALVGFWASIRQQTGISDTQFLRSMIPHHAGAILMCRQASIADDEIKALCKAIVSSQQSEIDQMKATLARIDRGRR